ncbi:hypothetical protein IJT93_04560 [bacterium]|nr:hypothetical protein [bacterium]
MTWRIPDSQLINAEPPASAAVSYAAASAAPAAGLKRLYEFSEPICHPLKLWRGFLLAVSDSSTVYAFKAEELKGPKAQPLRFLNLAEKKPADELISPLLKEIRGILAFPCGDKIYLWDMAAALLGRRISRSRPPFLALKGRLAADIATDGQNYLAALTRAGQERYRLEIFEFSRNSTEPYYIFELGRLGGAAEENPAFGGGAEPTFTLYCSGKAVYLLACSRQSAYDLEESGSLTCFSLASLTSKKLPGEYCAAYTADNVSGLLTEKIGSAEEGSRYRLCRIPENPVNASGLKPEFVDNIHQIRMYGRRGEGIWLIGSGVSRLEGKNSLQTMVAPELIDQISMDSIPVCIQGKFCVCLKSCQNGGRLYVFKDQFSFYPEPSISEDFCFTASLAATEDLCLGVSEDGCLSSLTFS